ncbi:MAG: hypothetical protein POELPBGB_02382 [Bacteroidia bacterium]|nr:hypothetical protein [Bacteroidia bacterium]
MKINKSSTYSIVFFVTLFLNSCENNKNQKIVSSINEPQDTFKISNIYKLALNAKDDLFFEDSIHEICSENFDYLGKLYDLKKNTYRIVNYSAEWGHNCRMTSRILVFSEDYNYLGNYYTHGFLPDAIYENALNFEDLDFIAFHNGIPDSIKIDSIVFNFYKNDN